MTIKYGLQVWDTQAFPLVDTTSNYFALSNVNAQRQLLMEQHAVPTANVLACAETLQQLADTLSNVHPWMQTYLQDLSEQFCQQSTAVLTINVPEQPSKFTILAYFVMMIASQYRMVTYNAAGEFYILPLEDKKMMSNFPELYKDNLLSIGDEDYYVKFMKIYRQALIAEGLVKSEDLIDWDQYSMTDDESDVKASKMAAEHVKAYLIETGMNFCFDEGRNVFTIPIKKTGDATFELVLDVWAVMRERGIGRIGLRHYLSVENENALQENSFLQHVNNEFKIYFGESIHRLSIVAIFDLFDYRDELGILYSGFRIYPNIVSEYNTWSDLFSKIDDLIVVSTEILSDIQKTSDFLKLIEEGLGNRITMEDLTIFRMNDSLCICYLMYAKLFRQSLFPILVDSFRKIYMNLKSKEQIFHLIDYIQNYELAT